MDPKISTPAAVGEAVELPRPSTRVSEPSSVSSIAEEIRNRAARVRMTGWGSDADALLMAADRVEALEQERNQLQTVIGNARTYATELQARADAAEAQVSDLERVLETTRSDRANADAERDRLKVYAQHTPDCPQTRSPRRTCTCGLEAVLTPGDPVRDEKE